MTEPPLTPARTPEAVADDLDGDILAFLQSGEWADTSSENQAGNLMERIRIRRYAASQVQPSAAPCPICECPGDGRVCLPCSARLLKADIAPAVQPSAEADRARLQRISKYVDMLAHCANPRPCRICLLAATRVEETLAEMDALLAAPPGETGA